MMEPEMCLFHLKVPPPAGTMGPYILNLCAGTVLYQLLLSYCPVGGTVIEITSCWYCPAGTVLQVILIKY